MISIHSLGQRVDAIEAQLGRRQRPLAELETWTPYILPSELRALIAVLERGGEPTAADQELAETIAKAAYARRRAAMSYPGKDPEMSGEHVDMTVQARMMIGARPSDHTARVLIVLSRYLGRWLGDAGAGRSDPRSGHQLGDLEGEALASELITDAGAERLAEVA
jgi:hypothetical protein